MLIMIASLSWLLWRREITKKKLDGEKTDYTNDRGINKNTVEEEIQNYRCLDTIISLKTLRYNEEGASFKPYVGIALKSFHFSGC